MHSLFTETVSKPLDTFVYTSLEFSGICWLAQWDGQLAHWDTGHSMDYWSLDHR
jgi:hypothetical protein